MGCGGGVAGGGRGRTLVVEAVDAVDRGALVVAAQQEEVLRVLDLVGQQQADALQPVRSAVNVVAAVGGRRAKVDRGLREGARSFNTRRGRREGRGLQACRLSGRLRPLVTLALCLEHPLSLTCLSLSRAEC